MFVVSTDTNREFVVSRDTVSTATEQRRILASFIFFSSFSSVSFSLRIISATCNNAFSSHHASRTLSGSAHANEGSGTLIFDSPGTESGTERNSGTLSSELLDGSSSNSSYSFFLLLGPCPPAPHARPISCKRERTVSLMPERRSCTKRGIYSAVGGGLAVRWRVFNSQEYLSSRFLAYRKGKICTHGSGQPPSCRREVPKHPLGIDIPRVDASISVRLTLW